MVGSNMCCRYCSCDHRFRGLLCQKTEVSNEDTNILYMFLYIHQFMQHDSTYLTLINIIVNSSLNFEKDQLNPVFYIPMCDCVFLSR